MPEPHELSADLARTILEHTRRPSTKTEEDLRIGVESALAPVLSRLGINAVGEYERTVLGGGRQDAVYGKVIIEAPGTLKYDLKLKHCQEQLRDYLMATATIHGQLRVDALRRLIGVGLDGSRIFFLRFTERPKPGDQPTLAFLPATPQLSLFKVPGLKGGFQRLGPYPVTPREHCGVSSVSAGGSAAAS